MHIYLSLQSQIALITCNESFKLIFVVIEDIVEIVISFEFNILASQWQVSQLFIAKD
jgi:hypothetical protein